jgi:maleylacetoacetate isomerase
VIRAYRIPHSTNCERVALALGLKGLDAEWVEVPRDDRTPVRAVSGQDLVPVLVEDGAVIADSTAILVHLDRAHPDPPLYPADAARRAEVEVFVEWFNGVWKVAPNAIEAELGRPEPDSGRIAELGARMTAALDLFEALLDGRDHLMGARPSAADLCAFPFLKQGLLGLEPDDDEVFHRVLVDHQPIGDRHPRLSAWIRRVDRLPRA